MCPKGRHPGSPLSHGPSCHRAQGALRRAREAEPERAPGHRPLAG
ncbi:hypothetical protein SGPA1_12438 [Streptomyces misionensis JCM 4497]